MKPTEQKRGNNGGITAQLLPVTQELMQTSIATTQA